MKSKVGFIISVIRSCKNIEQLSNAYNWAYNISIQSKDVQGMKDIVFNTKKTQLTILKNNKLFAKTIQKQLK